MGIIYTLIFILAIILNSIESSLQHKKSPIGGHPLREKVSIPSATQDSPDTSLPLASIHSPARSSSPARSPPPANLLLRDRSRSPPLRFTVQPALIDSSEGVQYRLDQLENIRLMPYENVHRVFELRKYTFLPGAGIQVLSRDNVFAPVPNQEQIVLSTFDGDIFAILERNNVLTGIYASSSQSRRRRRAKINIQSGLVNPLTSEEIKEISVGSSRPLISNFNVYKVDPQNLHPIYD